MNAQGTEGKGEISKKIKIICRKSRKLKQKHKYRIDQPQKFKESKNELRREGKEKESRIYS